MGKLCIYYVLIMDNLGRNVWYCVLVLLSLTTRFIQGETEWINVLLLLLFQSNTIHWPNDGLMLGQRRRRWANNKPTLLACVVSIRKLHPRSVCSMEIYVTRHFHRKFQKLLCNVNVWAALVSVATPRWTLSVLGYANSNFRPHQSWCERKLVPEDQLSKNVRDYHYLLI